MSNCTKTIGAFNNPLDLQLLSPMRELFKRVITEFKGGVNGYQIKDVHKSTYSLDFFLMNLATNPILTKSDMLIGAYLHLRIWEKGGSSSGLMFWTSSKNQNEFYFGDSTEFWVTHRGNKFKYNKPIINLYEDLIKYKIYLKPETVIKSLRKLHGCYFISMTTKHGNSKLSDDPTIRSELRHISIYSGMVVHPIYLHWRKIKDIDLSGLNL